MNLHIYAGMRVLYKKNNSNWLVGEIDSGKAILNQDGLFIPILTKDALNKMTTDKYTWDDDIQVVHVNINDVFLSRS